MNKIINNPVISSLVKAINARDLAELNKVFTEDVIMEWPQSGERIRGNENRRAIYSRFPSLPKITPVKTTGRDDLWILEAVLDYGEGDSYQCVFILELKNNLIARETVYWSKPFPAPEWRAPWVEKL